MKEGWECKSLGDVCEILDSRRKPITKNKREYGTIPYYGATGILDYVKDYIFDEKLVLLGEDGAKWGAGENSAYIVEGKTWVNNHAHALRPKREHIIDELLVYYLNFANLQPFITGVTVPKLNQEKMRSIEIPVPPLSEQQSIVDYLDSAFAKIDAMKANAEKALNEAKALFQASLKEMLEPKEGWEVKTLKETAKYRRGSFPQPYGNREWYDGEGSMPFVQVAELQEDSFNLISVTKKRISKLAQPLSVFVPAGTVLVSLQGSIGKVAITDYDSYVDRTVAIFQDYKIEIDKTFFAYQLKSRFEIERLKARGTTIKTITKEEFANFSINCPPISEQQSIVDTLDSLKFKVDRLQENFDKISQECDALKQAILRQVFE